MKFELSNCKSFFNKDNASDMKQMKKLKELGFKFSDNGNKYHEPEHWYLECNSGHTIEINTLEELISFCKKFGRIVLTENEIEIYDDYRE